MSGMKTGKVSVSVVTPNSLHSKLEVDMVVVPSSLGEMGIMSGHVPVSVMLSGGEVRFYSADKVIKSLQLESGFAEVLHDNCTILTTCVG